MSVDSSSLFQTPTRRPTSRWLRIQQRFSAIFREYGATEIVEAWSTDVRDGKITDFKRAVQAREDETVVFSWIVWPDKATADACEKKMPEDERMMPPGDMPFDGKRMIFGGFTPIFEMGR